MNWREKFTNIVGDYEREIYVWIEGSGERGGIELIWVLVAY